MGEHGLDPEAAQHAEVGGGQHLAGRQHDRADVEVVPAGRTWLPTGTSIPTRTCPSSTSSVRSTITTASAPAGIGAPVKMRLA